MEEPRPPSLRDRYLRLIGRNVARDVDEELAFHIDRRTEELIAQGVDPARARELALRRFGDVDGSRSECIDIGKRRERRMGRAEYLSELRRDAAFAFRSLRRHPGFAAVALLTLTLGIGATSAIFSVVNGVLLRSLPFAEPERTVLLYTGYPDDETTYPLSPPDFMSYHDAAVSFSGVTAAASTDQTLTGTGEPLRVPVAIVSADFFDVMGVTPVIGRTFVEDENRPGENGVAVLTHAWWRTHFGASRDVIGRTVTLDGTQREIVGVLPPEFDFPNDRAIYYPLSYDERYSSTTAQGRRGEFLRVVARLRDGVSMEAAAAEVTTISRRLQQEFPETNSENIDIALAPLRDQLLGDVRTPLLILLGAAAFVLLIACVNVATLLLARASAREGELAVRTALGAGRGRVVRQLLGESLVLGALGGAGGLLLAVLGTKALVAVRPEGIPRLDEIGVDGTVVAFTALVAIGTSIFFGLVPAVQLTRMDLSRPLREGGRGALGGRAGNRARKALVVGEMALAVVLLVGAGLFIRSFAQLMAVDPGFRTEGLVTFPLSLPPSSYEGAAQVGGFYQALLERVEALPGVETSAAGSEIPLRGTGSILGFVIEGREPRPGFVVDAAVTAVTPGYFSTLAIPLGRGRLLDEQDRSDAPSAAVVNESFVRRYFPTEGAVGRRISFSTNPPSWRTVVGVVGDFPQYTLDRAVRPAIYVPHEQFTTRSLTVIARTAADPLALVAPLRQTVSELDPDLPVERFTTGEQLVSDSVAPPRFYMALLTLFAAVALVLAAVGIFGVLSYLVAQRRREIGIRMALGARSQEVLRSVVVRALGLAGIGLGIGVAGALALTTLLESQLFGITPSDPLTFAGVVVVLAAVALSASWLPARRAARVDPVVALREE